MPSLVLGDAGDQDESGLGRALKEPGPDGRTDIDGHGCAETVGSPGETFFEFGVVGKGLPGEGPLELDLGGAGDARQSGGASLQSGCGEGVSA